MIFTIITSLIINSATIQTPPPIDELHKVAIKYLSLDQKQTKILDKNSRTQALMPKIVFEYEQRARTTLDLDSMDSVYVGSEMVNVGPSKNSYSRDAQDHQNIVIKALWNLNQLIYSKDQLNISAERRAINRERQAVLNEINKLYFEWIKARDEIIEYSKKQNSSKRKEINELKIKQKENSANIDALTNGWFSRNIREEHVE